MKAKSEEITSCINGKRITTNSTNPYVILVTFRTFFFNPFSSFNDEKKLNYKDSNKQIKTCDNGNVQSHDQEESKMNSTINANSGAHTLAYDQMIKKNRSNKKNVATIKTNKILTKTLLLGPVE